MGDLKCYQGKLQEHQWSHLVPFEEFKDYACFCHGKEKFINNKRVIFLLEVLGIYTDISSPACEKEHKYICIGTKMKLSSSEGYFTP